MTLSRSPLPTSADHGGAPRRVVRVTDIGEFVRHKSCQRRFALGYDNQAKFKELAYLVAQPFATIDPVLAEQGKLRETQWAKALTKRGFRDLQMPEEEPGKGAPWETFVTCVGDLESGQPAFAREVQIMGHIGAFTLYGRIDFVLVRWREGQPVLQLVECKASRKDRTYQRMQVVIYRMIVRQILESQPLVIGGRVVSPRDIAIHVVRIDEHTHEMIALDDLAPIESAGSLEVDICQLLSHRGPLDTILDEDLDELPFQLEGKCDVCRFNVHCLSESSRQRRLELLGLPPDTVRALYDTGVESVDHLAQMDPSSAAAEQLRRDPEFTLDIDTLLVRAKTRCSTLPPLIGEESKLDQEDAERRYQVTALPHSGYGQLPMHENYDPLVARGMTWGELQKGELPKHRLMRVFMSVSYDYVEDRIDALSAHVTCSDHVLHTPMVEIEQGNWQPDPRVMERSVGEDHTHIQALSGATIVEVRPSDWSGRYEMDCASEQALLRSFFSKLVEQIQLLAESPHIPLHFYVWSSQEITRLIEACNRTGGGMLRYVRELFGCRESLEQLIYSDLSQELGSRYAFGWTGRSLSVLTSLRWFGQRYHWRRQVGHRVYDLDEEFGRDLFDFRSKLYLGEKGGWVERDDPLGQGVVTQVRTRFFDQLSAPYWRAFWRSLPDPDDASTKIPALLVQPLRDYRRASQPGVLKAYLEARVHAMRWLEERVQVKNRSIRKPLIDHGDLPNFQLQTESPAEAAVDYLRLDQHIKFTTWLQSLLVPPYVRVANGQTLPIKEITLASSDGRQLVAKLDLVPCYMDAETMRARSSIAEGKMVRLHPRHRDPREAQSTSDLIWRGSTCVIKRIDWERGEVQLDVIPSPKEEYRNEYYTIKSYGYGKGYDPPEFATLDASITNFVDARVEKRLVPRDDEERAPGAHMERWFDPIEPIVPPMPGLDAQTEARVRRILQTLRLSGGEPLLARRVEIIVRGLSARIQLIQGPPGTGKTMVTAIAILARVLARRERGDIVLVAAHTHTAVDTLLKRIARIKDAFGQVARAQGVACAPVALGKIHSSEIEEPCGQGVFDFKACGSYSLIKKQCEEAVVVLGGTTSGLLKLVEDMSKKAAFRDDEDGFQTPFLVIDEASMMVCAHFLALATCVRADGEMLLAGDHRQLAPIMAHDWENEDRPPAQRYRMHESAFDAVVRMRYPETVEGCEQQRMLSDASIRRDGLETTYRLPPDIRTLIQPLYDRDQLVLRGPEGERVPERRDGGAGLGRVWGSSHSLYLLAHHEDTSRQSNVYEAHLVRHLLDAAIDAGTLRPKSVAIVTPHRAQRALLTVLLEGYSEYVEMVDTVERLQGGEAEVIVFSATVSDPVAIAQEVEFILDIERANVAFSRTKHKLVVLAARTLLDFVPPEVTHYQTALLWKQLRAMCTREIVSGELSMIPYSILVPASPWADS